MEETILYNVDDCAVFPISAIGDATTAPTYNTPVDVPAFQTIGLDPKFVSAQFKGDGKTIDRRSSLETLTASVEYGKVDLKVLPSIAGGTLTTGTTETDRDRYVRKDTDTIPEFGLCVVISEVDNPGAQAMLAIFRCKVDGGTLFAAEQDEYGTPSFNLSAYGLPDDGSMFAIDFDQTPASAGMPADGATFLGLRDALT